MEKVEFAALIPLRGGSKGIKNKNIKPFMGEPLCFWALKAACEASQIQKVYVSTDSELIKQTISGFNLEIVIIDRPKEFAADTSSTESVMTHFAEEKQFDNLVTIQATSPLLLSGDLDEAIHIYKSREYDSLFSAVRTKRFFWTDTDTKPLNYNYKERPRRQDFNGLLMENGSFYITSNEVLMKTNCRLGGSIGYYEMPDQHSLELDEPIDWIILENLAKNYNLGA